MMQGIACADPALAGSITERAFQQGLIIETSGGRDEVIKLLMPLTIDVATLATGLDMLELAIADATAAYSNTHQATKEEIV
jgi:diaminobutyrate-2-oxoglutarate transaminase